MPNISEIRFSAYVDLTRVDALVDQRGGAIPGSGVGVNDARAVARIEVLRRAVELGLAAMERGE